MTVHEKTARCSSCGSTKARLVFRVPVGDHHLPVCQKCASKAVLHLHEANIYPLGVFCRECETFVPPKKAVPGRNTCKPCDKLVRAERRARARVGKMDGRTAEGRKLKASASELPPVVVTDPVTTVALTWGDRQ